MRRAGPTWRSSPKSAVPCGTAPPAFPPPKISLLLITLRDSGSRIGTRYPPVGWSAAALLIRRRTPKRRTRSRCYGPSTDSVSVKLIKKVCWFNTGDGKDAETALSSRNFPRIIIGRCRVHCWFMVYTRGGQRRASVKGSRDPLLPKAHPHSERSYTLDAAPTRDGAPDPGSRKIAVGLHTEVRFGTTSVSPS